MLVASDALPDNILLEYEGETVESRSKRYTWSDGGDWQLDYEVSSEDAFISMTLTTTNSEYNDIVINSLHALVPQPIPQGYIPVDGTTIGFNRNGELEATTLPSYSSTDAGKALTVNQSGDGVEWATAGGSSTGGVRIISVVGEMSKNSISAEDKAYMFNHYNDPVNYPFIMVFKTSASDPTGNTYYPVANHDGGNFLSVWCPTNNMCIKWIISNDTVYNQTLLYGPNAIISPSTLQVFRTYGVTDSAASVADNFKWIKDRLCPTTTDGTFVLKATVANGAVTYQWVAE